MSPVQPAPHIAEVEVAEVALDIPDWPRGACGRMLRGALCAELRQHVGDELHVDWHGHASDGTVRQALPPILYRVQDGRPSVWMMGERAGEHLALMLRKLRAVRLAGGDVVEVRGMDLRRSTCHVRTTPKRWQRYELVSPLFPTDVAWKRRPRQPGPERWAWAGQLVRKSMAELLRDVGVPESSVRHLHVHVHDYDDRRVEWRRQGRGLEIRRWGFVARLVVNAVLPDGCALGKHRSEGWGVVRCR